MMIRAVYFDLDDTLTESAPAWRAGLNAAFARLLKRRPGLSREAIQAAWQAASRTLGQRLDSGELTVAEVRERRWRDTLATLGVGDGTLAVDLEATLADTYIGGLRLYDDTGVIERLRGRSITIIENHRSSHVGIITNGAADEALDANTPRRCAWGC